MNVSHRQSLPLSLRLSIGLYALVIVPSCMVIRQSSQTYHSEAQSPAVNGAELSVEFDPQKAKGAISASAMVIGAARAEMQGPWEIHLLAKGLAGDHTQLTVHGLTVRTNRGLSEALPDQHLHTTSKFEPSRQKGITQAAWQMPGEFTGDFQKDTIVTLKADISVARKSHPSVRQQVTFTFRPQTTKSHQNLFLPSEIIDGIRHHDVPFEQSDRGVNRKR